MFIKSQAETHWTEVPEYKKEIKTGDHKNPRRVIFGLQKTPAWTTADNGIVYLYIHYHSSNVSPWGHLKKN